MALNMTLTQPGKLRLFSTAELVKMPPPNWLVNGIMPEEGVIGLYGAPSTGKSFVAVDLACAIGSGTPWQGHTVRSGLVIYISAEGGAGIGKRVLAWAAEHKVNPATIEVAWIIEAIPITASHEDMQYLFDRIDEIREQPVLVVIDTLARCFEGDENLQEDMGAFIKGVDMIRQTLDTAVLIVHHTRLDGDRERGNTAFRGAADTMIHVKRQRGQNKLALLCDKQKDDEEFAPLHLRLEKREEENSCVIRGASVPEHLAEFLQALRSGGVRTGESYAVADLQTMSGESSSTFFRKLRAAKDEGLLDKRKGKYVLKS
jgi:hypothetical protein